MKEKTEDALAWILVIVILAIFLWGIYHFIGGLDTASLFGTSLH